MDGLLNTDLGAYHLVEVIGRGGMATVYKAHHATLERFVAVKVFAQSHDEQSRARFKAEARLVAQLHHPNILPSYDYGEHGGVLYLVTPYVDQSMSLAGVAKPQPLAVAVPLVVRLLDALQHTHDQGVVHRDVKPSNVLLPRPDWPLLADFGIAKLVDGAGQNITTAGQVVGTAAYMAPEQAAGDPVDARTDLYAVGVLFYELLTGQVPFGAGPPSVVLARHTSAPPSPRRLNPMLPAAVEPILQRALAKRPDERYPSARAMIADLERLTIPDGRTPGDETGAATQLAPPAVPPRRWRWMPAILVLMLVALLGSGAAGVMAGRRGTRASSSGAPPPGNTAPAATSPAAALASPPDAAPPEETIPAVTNPGAAALPAAGRVVWRDDVLWNDQVVVVVDGLPPPEADQVYTAWLVGANGSLVLGRLAPGDALGPLPPGDAGSLTVSYQSPTHANLLAIYDRVVITEVPEVAAETEIANVILAGTLPHDALIHIRHLLVSFETTPNQIGFALGLRQEADEVLLHARFLAEAFDAGNLAAQHRHAEHLVNIIEGVQGEHAGDLNGDGMVQNPGDGFGLLENGQQLGYIQGMVGHAVLAAEAQDATDTIKTRAASVQAIGEAIRARVTAIRDHALNVGQAETPAETQQAVRAILELARQTIDGIDANQNGHIEADPNEGGVLLAYQHAQFMADVRLAPSTADDAPPPKPIAQTGPLSTTITIQENAFVPRKLTIPVGTTVIWQNQSSDEHTVTHDAGRFDSGTIAAGGSFEITFPNAGTYSYFCQHDGGPIGEGMAGTVIVQERSAAGQP